VVLEIGKTAYDQFVVLDEYYESEAHLEDAIGWLKRNQKPKGCIYCEHEPSEIEKFRRAGWRAEQAWEKYRRRDCRGPTTPRIGPGSHRWAGRVTHFGPVR
jgi:hypothetical protein